LAHHPQEDLAKFGYMSKRKVENLRIPCIFWLHVGTCCLNLATSEVFDELDPIFSGLYHTNYVLVCIMLIKFS
jgi:hypothetical protein